MHTTVADKKKFPFRLRSTLNAYMENGYKTLTKCQTLKFKTVDKTPTER